MARVPALRRARAEVAITSAALVAVTLALVLLASGPIFADAVSTGALRRSLADAPASERAIVIDARLWPDQVEGADAVVRAEVDRVTRDIDAVTQQTVETSTGYSAPEQPDPDRTDLFRFGWVEGIGDQVTITAGEWPAGPGDGRSIEVAVDETAAEVFGLELGQTVDVTARNRDADVVEVVIVAQDRLDDPFASFWHGRDRLAEPVTVTPAFRTVNLLVGDPAAIAGIAARPDVGWLVLPDFGDLELDEVDSLRSRVVATESELNASLFDPDPDRSPEVVVETELPALLVSDDRSVTVARAVIFATVGQLSALAAFALTLVAGLGVDARRAESTMLRARGADPRQLTRQAAVDAAAIVVPVAIAAPFLAVLVVGWFDDFGPLSSIGLQLDPRPVTAAWWTTVVAAVATLVLLVVPAARAAIAAASEGEVGRAALVSPIQRSGIDLAVVAAAGFAYWQLRTLSDEQAAEVTDRFGVDPLVVLAPMFGIVAGALLVLRVLPVIGRLAERRQRSRRGVVGALAVWQLARRPYRYTRTALLVTMAVAVGTFASIYEVTWTASQRAQAAHEVAADIRVQPNRRVGDSVNPLQLTSLLDSIDGVETVMSVVALPTSLPGDEREAVLLAAEVDSSAALNAETEPDTVAALDRLRDRRPELPGIDLPGEPVRLSIPNQIVEVDEFGRPLDDDPEAPPPLAGSLELTIQDGDGLLHVVSAGPLAVDTPVRSIHLGASDIDPAAVPRPPLRIVDVQLDTVTQGAVNRSVEVTVGPIEVVDRDGSVAEVALDPGPLMVTTEVLGFLAAPSSSTVTTAAEGSLTIGVRTGASLLAVRIVHTVTRTQFPEADVIAGLADRGWAERADVSIGDVVAVPTDRGAGLRVEVLGFVDVVPGVDPTTTPAVLVDLPSMQWFERSPGTTTRRVREYWLGVTPGADLDVDAFTRPPVEALDGVVLEARREELTANPSALGSLGALGAGFLASVILAVMSLVVTTVVSVRERTAEFAVLDALGLTRGQRRSWLVREQAAIVVFGVGVGTAIGLGLAYLVLPVTSSAQDGGSTFPPVDVIVPWARVLGLAAVVAATSMAAVGIALLLRARASTAVTLRTGVDG